MTVLCRRWFNVPVAFLSPLSFPSLYPGNPPFVIYCNGRSSKKRERPGVILRRTSSPPHCNLLPRAHLFAPSVFARVSFPFFILLYSTGESCSSLSPPLPYNITTWRPFSYLTQSAPKLKWLFSPLKIWDTQKQEKYLDTVYPIPLVSVQSDLEPAVIQACLSIGKSSWLKRVKNIWYVHVIWLNQSSRFGTFFLYDVWDIQIPELFHFQNP